MDEKEETYLLLEPTLLITNNSFQISIHKCSKSIRRQLVYLFPDQDIDSILAIPTLQHSDYDLVNIGEKIDDEKDKLLENVSFMSFASKINQEIRQRGYWCDYIDPCSGLAMNSSQSNRIYSEVEGMQALLNYRVMNAGCCKILLHPQWGSAVYPATIFTTAPYDVLIQILDE